jgi:hypothetical protein
MKKVRNMSTLKTLLTTLSSAMLVVTICLGSLSSHADEKDGLTSKRERDRWATEASEKAGITLVRKFDSRGDAAWDPKEHPVVFITSEGPGYGGLMSGIENPGFAIIDADTREVVTSVSYDVLDWGWKNVFEPHGLGISADGQWIYLPTGEGSFATIGEHAGRFLIINARTLKLDKVITIQGQAHHGKSYFTNDDKPRTMLYGWSQPLFILDPEDDNRVIATADHRDQGSEAYTYFMSPDNKTLLGTGRYRSFDMRKHLVDNPLIFFDPETLKVQKWVNIHDSAPVWVAFTLDNELAYISGARHSEIFKLDLNQGEITATQRAGVDGPYGAHFGWDDRFLYTIGKGEESHNRGKMVGKVDTATMNVDGARAMDQFYTGCTRGDHGTLHPDPEANEMWITCNASFEVVVFDLDLNEVTERIAMPNGGSTHSGGFVHYPNGWEEKGEVVSDMNGLHGTALQAKKDLLGIK